jgi:lipopolysaccharide export system permease protein
MSSRDLYAYIKFLDENRLGAEVERLIFWQKIFTPVTIVIMCLLAFPFVLGSQRQSNTGQRLLIGILLGLSFAVVDRVLTQLGVQFGINAFTVAVMPNLLFFSLAVFMLIGKSGQGAGIPLFSRLLRR